MLKGVAQNIMIVLLRYLSDDINNLFFPEISRKSDLFKGYLHNAMGTK